MKHSKYDENLQREQYHVRDVCIFNATNYINAKLKSSWHFFSVNCRDNLSTVNASHDK